MKYFLQLFFFLLIGHLGSYAQLTGNYTINSNLLTSATNFQSFSDFTTTLSNQGVSGSVNVTVAPGSGPYFEQVIFGSYSGASALNRVTINGNGETISYNPPNGFADLRIIGFNQNTQHIILDSLYITGSKGVGVSYANGADYNVVRNCTISITNNFWANFSTGIAIAGCDHTVTSSACPTGGNASHITIENNTILGTRNTGVTYGIWLKSTASSGIGTNNIVRNNKIENFLVTGIKIENQNNVIVSKNKVSRELTEFSYSVYGISLYNTLSISGGILEKNHIFNLNKGQRFNINEPAYGIYTEVMGDPINPIKLENNIISNLEHTNDSIFGIYVKNSSHVNFYHNTISCFDSRPASSDRIGFSLQGACSFLNLKNNLIRIESRNTGDNIAFNLPSNSTNITCDYNNVWLKSASANLYFGATNNNKYITLSDWNMANGGSYGTNNLYSDPVFISNSNFIPRSSSINNQGSNLNVIEDFSDSTRGIQPDIGAYEFSCGLPSNIQVKQIADTSVLISWDSIPNHNQEWDVIYSKFNFSPNNLSNRMIVAGGRTSVILSPLVFDETYNFYIRTICGAGDTSLWSDQLTFKKTFPVLRGNYTINSTLPTQGRNFSTFKDFTDRLIDVGVGDTVKVDVVAGTGPYYEQVIFKNIKGQSRFHPIVINGNDEIISHSPTFSDRRIVGFESAKHITLTNLEIRINSSNHGYGVHFLSKSDSNTVKNCNIILESSFSSSNTGLIGIHSSSFIDRYVNSSNYPTASHLKIIDNTISGGVDSSLMNGISLIGSRSGGISERSSFSTIQGNVVKDFYKEGITLNFQYDAKIISNTISSPHKSRNYDIIGISVESESYNVNHKIEKNKIHNLFSRNDAKAIYFDNPSFNAFHKVSISNNLIHSIKADNRIIAIEVNRGTEIDVYHNTIAINDSSVNSCHVLGVSVTEFSSNYTLDLRNNIISIIHGGSGNKYFFIANGRVEGQLISNNNCFFYGGIGTNRKFCSASTPTNNGRIFTSLEDWLSGNSSLFDSKSMMKQPYFVSPTNYRPSNLALSSAGDNVFEPQDFYGNYRDSTPDLGAINLLPNTNLPFYPISKITAKRSSNVVDSIGVSCKTSGVAHGINFKNNNGLDFYLVDQNNAGQASIRVNSNFNVSNYYFTEGDSIEVEGQVQQILGKPYLLANSIRIIQNSSNALTSSLVNKPAKAEEGKIIELQNIKLLDANQSQTSTLRALNRFGDTLLIQVDSLTDVNDSLNREGFVPNDSVCSIVGICAQRGASQMLPLEYYILPLRFSDIDTISCIETAYHQEVKDTVKLMLRNCLDSNLFSYALNNTSNANINWIVFATAENIEDNFNQGLNAIWEDSSGVSFLNKCGNVDGTMALTFNGGTNRRFIESYPLNLSCRSEISVSAIKGGDCSNGTFSGNQQLQVEYSTNFGVSWRILATIESTGDYVFTIPDTTKVNLAKIRFIQQNSTGNDMQVWLLDNFKIKNEPSNCNQSLMFNQSEGILDANDQITIAGFIHQEKLKRGLNYYPVPIYSKSTGGNMVKYLVVEIDYVNDFCVGFEFNALSCGSSYQFINLTQGENLTYEWSFEGSSVKKIDKNPTHFFASEGIKTVMLKVCDEFTCDSIIQQVYIESNFGPSQPACAPIDSTIAFWGSGSITYSELIDRTIGETTWISYFQVDPNITMDYPSADLSCDIRYHLNINHDYMLKFGGYSFISGNKDQIFFYGWLDYNNDNFLDSNERFVAGTNGSSVTTFFNVPDSAVLNMPLRMRLMLVKTSRNGTLYEVKDCNTVIQNEHIIRDHTVIIMDSAGFSKPNTDFLYYQNNCYNEVDFENTTSNLPTSYLWDFGDGSTSTSSSTKHTYSGSGSYQVKLITSNRYGVDSISKTVQIKKPDYQIIRTGQLISHCPIQFEVKNDSNLIQTLWDFGNKKRSAKKLVNNTYPNGGVFEVNLTTVDSNLCVLEYADTLNIIGFTDSIVACKGFTWKDGNTYFENNETATYIFGTNPTGCDSVVRLDLTIIDIDTSLNKNGQTLTVNADSSSTFQWLSCSGGNFIAIPNETASTYTPASLGYYACEITRKGCKDTTRCELVVQPVASNAAFTNNPNPTLGDITFTSTNSSVLQDIFIRNSYGQIVYNKSSINSKSIVVPTDNWKPGIYNVIITMAGKSHSSKIVVI